MGYVNYITNYYKQKVDEYETKEISKSLVSEAKELLKVMDDLVDEGYDNAYSTIESSFQGISRLKKYILSNGEVPFILSNSTSNKKNIFTYQLIEINDYLQQIESKVNHLNATFNEHPLFSYLLDFCKWIEKGESSYIFLLRDTFLPYLAFRKKQIPNIYSLLISRRSLNKMTNDANLHDVFSNIIFTALSNNPKSLDELKQMIRKPVMDTLDHYKCVKDYLENFLKSIKARKIIVIESGYNGTFPLVLSVLDNRVTFKMFTTAPYLYQLYKDNYFTKDYHLNRLFETLISQDSMFNVTEVKNNTIFVSENEDKIIRDKGLEEINNWLMYLEKEVYL